MQSAEWENLVKDALKSWYDTDKLNHHPLTELKIVAEREVEATFAYEKAIALKAVMRSGMETLAPDGQDLPDANDLDDPRWCKIGWRPYSILTLLPRFNTDGVASAIGLAPGGQYFREQRKAIRMLAEVLRQWEGNPIDEASPIILQYPSGAMKAADPFYIEREADVQLHNVWSGCGETVTIRGSRQVGKSSLLIRSMHDAKSRKYRIVYFDLQNAGGSLLATYDLFLRGFADWIFDELDLDLKIVEKAWKSRLPAPRKLTKLLERHVLSEESDPVLLVMDEIDQLQQTDFHSDYFGLIRSWHNLRASREQWEKLSIAMAISTEPYLLISDLNQSPFNVGQLVYLQDFNEEQLQELNRRYDLALSQSNLDEMLQLLNGHPYLTRLAFYTLSSKSQSWKDFSAKAASDPGPYQQHLQHQLQLLLREPALHQVMKEIVDGRPPVDDQAAFRLMKAGLARKEGDAYFCRCALYRQYFDEKL